MRRSNANGRTAKTQGVSLSPEQRAFAGCRAKKAGISVSKYFQSLLEYDRKRNVLADALTAGIAA
jgi:hypothetical protein